MTEVGGQRSEVGGRMSDVGEQKPKNPIDMAKEIYERKRFEAAKDWDEYHPSFEDVLADHLRHGIVRSTSTCFAMAMPTQIHGKACLLVRAAVGKLRDMFDGFNAPVSRIAFNRRGGEIRVYPMDRFHQLSTINHQLKTKPRPASDRMNAF